MGLKIRLIIFLFSVGIVSFGQETILERFKIKTALSFSTGLLTENTQTTQVHGWLGFRPKRGKVELRGDGFYFLGSTGDRPRFSINHQLYAGAFYRFLDNNFQPYIGVQPGIAYSQASEIGSLDDKTGLVNYEKTFNPLFSAVGGASYFANKWFFMFVETRYIAGRHLSNSFPVFLDELRFSFGLGIHL